MKDGLSKKAYEPIPEGEEFEPFVPASESPLEFTLKSIVAGIFFGILFGPPATGSVVNTALNIV